VILARPEDLFLAPEFMLLGERWFPDWRTDHRAAFRLLVGAFGMLVAHGKIDVEKDSRLLDWAIRLEDWDVAPLICITLCLWYGEHGRLEDMKEIIEQLLPHATGMERIANTGSNPRRDSWDNSLAFWKQASLFEIDPLCYAGFRGPMGGVSAKWRAGRVVDGSNSSD